MRRHTDAFSLVIVLATLMLIGLFKSIYEDAAKAWVLAKLSQLGLAPEAATAMSGFIEISPALGAAVGIVWFLYRYIRHEFERKSITFVRELNIPEGDVGYYTAYVSVMNTSPTEKLKDCRCEITELRDDGGTLLGRNIGLRTRGQENKETQGRFNLDQGSTKDIPIFEINQSRDDDGALQIINANNWDISLEHGTYIASLRAYGDSGLADEITLRLNSNNCRFEIIDGKSTASQTRNHLSSEGLRIGEPANLTRARVRLAELRSSGVNLRNTGMTLQARNGDFNAWKAETEDWLNRVLAEISNIDPADAEWFRVLDTVPEPRVPLYFPYKTKEGLHLKLHREHDYRLLRLDKLIGKYGAI